MEGRPELQKPKICGGNCSSGEINKQEGEFRLKYEAEETNYSPSPPRHGSIRSISICGRNGEEPAASGEDPKQEVAC